MFAVQTLFVDPHACSHRCIKPSVFATSLLSDVQAIVLGISSKAGAGLHSTSNPRDVVTSLVK